MPSRAPMSNLRRCVLDVSNVQSRESKTPTRRAGFLSRRKVDQVDFVVAGVQKAGTTAIHDFLAQHPQIALLRDQADHFFDKEEHFRDEPNYQIMYANFKPGRHWQTAGEVTADYLYYPR